MCSNCSNTTTENQYTIQHTHVMKLKLTILTIFSCSSLLFTTAGCKKYTCECTAYNTNNPEPGGHTSFSVRKKDRNEFCTEKSTQPDMYGNYTTCILK